MHLLKSHFSLFYVLHSKPQYAPSLGLVLFSYWYLLFHLIFPSPFIETTTPAIDIIFINNSNILGTILLVYVTSCIHTTLGVL